MLTNTAAPTIFALIFLSAVLANAAAPAILAQAFLSAVLANAAAPAILALILLSVVLAISRAWVQLNPYKRFCWNRAAVLQLLEAAGGRVGDGQRQRHFVELGLLVLILRHEQKN